MQTAHIIHAHIALHKTDLSDYIAIIGSGMIQRNGDRAQTSSCRPDLEKVETAIHLNPGSGRPGSRKAADRIRAGALLLPALVRYDWQHSSSQLPIIPNDARRISSPGGRYCVHGPVLKAASSPNDARIQALPGTSACFLCICTGSQPIRAASHPVSACLPFTMGASTSPGPAL